MTGTIIGFGKISGHGLRGRGSTLAAATLALTLSTSAVAFAEDAKFDPNASITIGSLYEPQNLDNTAGAGQGINEAFNGNVYEALFTLTDAGDVQPGLVAEQSVSEDGLTYTFKLRSGVTFHSGDPLTAADVKYSIERVTAEQSKSRARRASRRSARSRRPMTRLSSSSSPHARSRFPTI